VGKAQDGDKVKVHYTGKLEDGTVFDSSDGRDPIEFTLGQGQVIPGFENGILGMETGDKKTLSIPADQAYGQKRDDLVGIFKKDQFPPGASVEVGDQFQMQQQDGSAIQVRIVVVKEEEVTVDANHPLAGETLVFDIELVEIAA